MKKGLQHRGQGLTEYLILLCLIAVSTIAVVSVVGQNIRARYKNISQALHGDRPTDEHIQAGKETFQIRGLHDFGQSSQAPGNQ